MDKNSGAEDVPPTHTSISRRQKSLEGIASLRTSSRDHIHFVGISGSAAAVRGPAGTSGAE